MVFQSVSPIVNQVFHVTLVNPFFVLTNSSFHRRNMHIIIMKLVASMMFLANHKGSRCYE